MIHIHDAPLAERDVPAAITLQPLTGPDCDVTVLIFTFPPNYVGKVHLHPTDTVYVIRRGQFIVERRGHLRSGRYPMGQVGHRVRSRAAGPEGCEVMLIGAGKFPLPIVDPTVDPAPRGCNRRRGPGHRSVEDAARAMAGDGLVARAPAPRFHNTESILPAVIDAPERLSSLLQQLDRVQPHGADLDFGL